jgi:hypothetical protein
MPSIHQNAPRYPSNFVNSAAPADVTTTAGHSDDNVAAGRVIRDEVPANPLAITAITAASNGTVWTFTPAVAANSALTLTVTQMTAAALVKITGITSAGISETENVAVAIEASGGADATYVTTKKFRSITAIVIRNAGDTAALTPTSGDGFTISATLGGVLTTLVAVTTAAGPVWNYNGAGVLSAVTLQGTTSYNFGMAARTISVVITALGVTTTGARIQVTGVNDVGQSVTETLSFTDAVTSQTYTLANKYRSITNVVVLNEGGTTTYAGANANAFSLVGTLTQVYPTDYGTGVTMLGTPDAPYTGALSELNVALTNLNSAISAFQTADDDANTPAELATFEEGKLNRINWLRENGLNMTEELNKLLGKFDVLGLYKSSPGTNTNVVSDVPTFITNLPVSPYPTDLGRNWPNHTND